MQSILVGIIWFVFGEERIDPETDHPMDNGFLTWRRHGQSKPFGARYFAGVSRIGETREIHYETPEYCEGVRDYVSSAAQRLLNGEQFTHSQFRKLACPPTTPYELPSRMRLLDKFEEQVLLHEGGSEPDPAEDTLLERFELTVSVT